MRKVQHQEAGVLRPVQQGLYRCDGVQSARMNGHDAGAYLRDVLQALPTQLNTQLEELLPHRWTPRGA